MSWKLHLSLFQPKICMILQVVFVNHKHKRLTIICYRTSCWPVSKEVDFIMTSMTPQSWALSPIYLFLSTTQTSTLQLSNKSLRDVVIRVFYTVSARLNRGLHSIMMTNSRRNKVYKPSNHLLLDTIWAGVPMIFPIFWGLHVESVAKEEAFKQWVIWKW